MVPEIIQDFISSGQLEENSNAVYNFMISPDVNETMRPDVGKASFCTNYCGYHVSWKLASDTRIFYSIAGNSDACPDSCGAVGNERASPNGDIGVDSLISTVAHELAEAVSDPNSDGLRSWYDIAGNENADKCAVSEFS